MLVTFYVTWLGRNLLDCSSLDRPDRNLPVMSYIDIVP